MAAAIALIACVVAAPSAVPAVRATATVEAPTTDGTFTLSWSRPDGMPADDVEFEVELDPTGTGNSYTPWYRGPATQSFVSGLTDGVILARVRARQGQSPWTDWSPAAHAKVQHHSFAKALGFLSIGFIVFMTIALYIGYMALRVDDEQESAP